MNIGDRVKEQRSKLGLSAQKLANAIDVSVDMIRSIEINRARPSVETLAKLAMYFGCTADYLLGNTDDPRYLSRGNSEEFFEYLKQMTPEQRESLIKTIVSVKEAYDKDKGDS